MEWYEAAFDRLYPILYSHRDEEEARRAVDTFLPALASRTPVLDLASGDGRYIEALAERGVNTYGLDLSHYLLGVAVEQRGLHGRLVQGDMRLLPLRDACVGAVINMFTSFGYFSVDTDNFLVFREVSRVLRPGGVFLFDFINSEHISAHLLAHSSRQSGAYTIEERRRIEQHGKYLVKEATIIEPEAGIEEVIEERLRLYTKDDLLTMFESVGLEPRDVFGDYRGNPFIDGVSERVIVISEKR